MKAAQANAFGGGEVVALNPQVPEPVVSAGHLIVAVHAAAVNPFDWKLVSHFYGDAIPVSPPFTPCGDFSGVVLQVGEGVSGFRPGDEVYGHSAVVAGGTGSLAEQVSVSSAHVALKPRTLTHLEAAALPLAGSAAWRVLTLHMRLSKGQKVLIHGGAGGIGSFAVQIAHHLGAFVAATASARDLEFVRQLGADKVLDYKTQAFQEILHDFDAVFDTVGGETYHNSFKVVRRGGVVVSMVEPKEAPLLEKQYGVRAVNELTQVTAQSLAALAQMAEEGNLKVHIDKVFTLENAGEALDHLRQGHPRGKVVVSIR